MVMRKKVYKKKRAYRGRRKIAGRGGIRVYRGLLTGVHKFKETCELTPWSVAAASTQFGVQTYKLNDLFNSTSFKNLFDLYKIVGVKLTVIPQYSETTPADALSGAGGVINAFPMLYVAPNRSPWSTAPTGTSDILNDDGVRVMALNKRVSFYLKSPAPRLVDGAGTGMPIQTNINTRLWLSTGGNGQIVDQSGVEYYGHRWGIENPNTFGMNFKLYATYYFTMKEQD